MQTEGEPHGAASQVEAVIALTNTGFDEVLIEILRGLPQEQGHASLAPRFVG